MKIGREFLDSQYYHLKYPKLVRMCTEPIRNVHRVFMYVYARGTFKWLNLLGLVLLIDFGLQIKTLPILDKTLGHTLYEKYYNWKLFYYPSFGTRHDS